jgi:hypothetical protein
MSQRGAIPAMGRRMRRLLLIITALLAVAARAVAQTPADTLDTPDKTLFKRSDLVVAGAIAAGSAAVSLFDERIARWTQGSSIQTTNRTDLAEGLTFINETPLTLGAVATYGAGRLIGNETMADVGLHVTESLVMTIGIAELARVSLGRIRPRAAEGDAFLFEPGKGLTKFEARSFPSLHAAAAFATASALVAELDIRRPGVSRYAAPALYTAALVPGFTRLYLNQHWASDVVAGTMVGAFLGDRIVRYVHSHDRGAIDRVLLGASVMPTGDGRLMVSARLAAPRLTLVD